MAAAKEPKWRQLLTRFIAELRIVSREENAEIGEAGTKLQLWNSQTRLLDEMTAGMEEGIRRFYVLKSRQLGSTTIFVVIALFWHASKPRMKGAMVFDQDKTRDEFREVLRNIVASMQGSSFLGKSFDIAKNGDNKTFMSFTNGSRINFLVAGTSGSKVAWGESAGYSFVLLTEVASYGSPEGLSNFEEAMSETNPDRLYIYEGTAKGYNHWRDRWVEARADPYRSRCIFVGWWSKELNVIFKTDPLFAVHGVARPTEQERERIALVKERHGHTIAPEQLAWIRWRGSKASQSAANLQQNQPWVEEDAFILTGKSYFQPRVIAQDLERVGATPYQGYRFWTGRDFWSASLERLTDPTRKAEVELRVWGEPTDEGKYVIGMDPAGGSNDKNDRHCISVWRCYADKLVQVAEYADNIAETRHAAWVLAYLAGVYKNCMVNLELSGGYGKSVMTELDLLRDQLQADMNAEKRGPRGQDWTDFLSNARWYIYRRPDSPTANGYVLNWLTNNDNKHIIFNGLRNSHVNDELVINSRPMLDEMLIIVQDGSDISAPNHSKDDRTFAACLAHYAWTQHYRPSMIGQGETYEAVTAQENGEVGRGAQLINRIVEQFMAAGTGAGWDEVDPEDQWKQQRGLK
jgi:hypothetical protein